LDSNAYMLPTIIPETDKSNVSFYFYLIIW
jgi:hypothetical protein